jgi:hypothetical protein
VRYFCVIKDRQGGSFGMDRVYTAKEWGEQAYDWADSDDYECPEEWLLENHENEDALITYIADWWELDFAELNEEQKIKYEEYLKDIECKEQKAYAATLTGNLVDRDLYETELRNIYDAFDCFLDTLKEV